MKKKKKLKELIYNMIKAEKNEKNRIKSKNKDS